jgi:hypothetical protein
MTHDGRVQAPVETAPEPEAGPTHWWQRLLPVSGIAAALLALVAVQLPGLGDEIELSTSRSPQPFVELSLVGRPDALCARRSPQVRFRIESHLRRARTLGYRIGVDPARAREQAVRERGRTSIAPGEARSLSAEAVAPVGTAYDITVRVLHRPERLRVHCDGMPR